MRTGHVVVAAVLFNLQHDVEHAAVTDEPAILVRESPGILR